MGRIGEAIFEARGGKQFRRALLRIEAKFYVSSLAILPRMYHNRLVREDGYMYLASGWKDYEVLDAGGGEQLERWCDVVLRRPDPQAIWAVQAPDMWNKADAVSHRSTAARRQWALRR